MSGLRSSPPLLGFFGRGVDPYDSPLKASPVSGYLDAAGRVCHGAH